MNASASVFSHVRSRSSRSGYAPASVRCQSSIWARIALASGQLRRRGDLELGLVDVVEEGEEPVVVALGDRVVLVVVALGTADRQAEEDRARRVDPVDDRLDPELLDVDAPFLVDLRVAMKAGGDPLAERGCRAAGRRRADRS